MPKTYYEELLEQLDVAQANEPLMKELDKRLHNESSPTDYDAWVDNSLEFLRSHENLFIGEVPVNG